MRLETQWNVIPGGFVGLNYQSLAILFRIYGIDNEREMLENIQIMERAALAILNERTD